MNETSNVPLQTSFPHAFPCDPSHFSFTRVTSQKQPSISFDVHRVWCTRAPTPSFGSRESVSYRLRGLFASCALVEAGMRFASALGKAAALLAACRDMVVMVTAGAVFVEEQLRYSVVCNCKPVFFDCLRKPFFKLF